MQTIERLGAADLAAVVTAFRDCLRAHRTVIDRLNVYPVPDGDTGTNMALTVDNVVTEMEAADGTDLGAVTAAVRHGSLMGARGNSGVILSQILRGIADVYGAAGVVDRDSTVAALRRASDGAYAAVGNPVEGTILSVVRAGAEAAEAAPAAASLTAVVEAAAAGARAALARTPEQLPVLKAAGVVDAGGTGLVLLFDAFLHTLDGRPLPEADAMPPTTGGPVSAGGLDAGPGEHEVGELRYEVMYLLEAPDETIGAFRDVWAGVGDSIVVVGGEGTWNCHIHTNDIGAAVEAALDAGRPRRIRVTDLWQQVEEERWVREAAAPAAEDVPPVTCAVVAVCAGDGLRRVFHSLGVHQVVSGGQSMNPATKDLVAAIAATGAGEVVVLPNNRNIVAVAEAAAEVSPVEVRVVPTTSVPEGFAALLEYDPESPAEANAAAMATAAGAVVTGEVTTAVRAAVTPAGPVGPGEFLGLAGRDIAVVAPSARAAATGLLDHLLATGGHEILTVIEGEGSSPADTRAITEWVADHHPEVTAEVLEGDQPLYPYLFGVE